MWREGGREGVRDRVAAVPAKSHAAAADDDDGPSVFGGTFGFQTKQKGTTPTSSSSSSRL